MKFGGVAISASDMDCSVRVDRGVDPVPASADRAQAFHRTGVPGSAVDAGRHRHRAFQRADDIGHADLASGARQRVAAVHAAVRRHQPAPGHALQDLGDRRRRQPGPGSKVRRGHHRVGRLRQLGHHNDPVIGHPADLEHYFNTALFWYGLNIYILVLISRRKQIQIGTDCRKGRFNGLKPGVFMPPSRPSAWRNRGRRR